MRINTHERTPRHKNSKFILLLLILSTILVFAIFGLGACACIVNGNDLTAGVLLLFIPIVFAAITFIMIKDIKSAYVEINGDHICVVDYYLGIKKEKHFSFSDITSAEILMGYSHRVKGYRISAAGTAYIVFKNEEDYLFKIICIPETKEVFKRFI